MNLTVPSPNATFTPPGGGTVVNAGVTDWVLGLEDPVVARITRNVLERLTREFRARGGVTAG